MRYIKYAVIAVIAIALIVVALANRAQVTFRVLPEDMAGFLGWSWSLTLPLYLFIFAAIVAGVLIGYVLEWVREHKYRVEARNQRQQKEALERKVGQMRENRRRGQGDEILALLEDGSAPR